MRNLLIDTCIAILRKLNCSVLIGYETHGIVRSKNACARVYDCEINGLYQMPNGDKFDIPEGKFEYKLEVRNDEHS